MAIKTSPTRPPKGSRDLVKLANKYRSLDEMAMDLGGASSSSPNKGKHKYMAKLTQWNCCGLRANFEELELLIKKLRTCCNMPTRATSL